MHDPRTLTRLGLATVLAVVAGACTVPATNTQAVDCTGVTCSGRGLCVVTGGTARCQCESGYAPSGLQCIPSVGCDPNPCTQPHQTRCEVDSHQLICRCDLGWHDSGAGCAPDADNPCYQNPCTATHKTQCALENGEVRCKCDAGFAEDENGDCTILDPCSPSPCTSDHKTQCSNEGGATKCGCDAGYVEDQNGVCKAGDRCDPNPCTTANKTVCTVVAGQAYCSCVDGWRSDGQGGCVVRSACDPNPCIEEHRKGCSELTGGGHKCVCDPLYVDDGSGTCVLAPDPTCVAAHPNGDAYENDDCPANAAELPVGATQTRTIDLSGDVDWMKSTLQANHVYHWSVSGLDVAIALHGTDGTTVVVPEIDRSGVSAPEVLSWTPTADGVYFFKARYYSLTGTGGYSVTLTDRGVEDHGNDAAHATAITTLGTAVNGTIDYAGDNDWFAFDTVLGHLYEVNTTGINTYVYVVDTDGTTVLKESDLVPFYLPATVTGTYYVRVRHYSSSSTGAYTLTVTGLGIETSGDDAATAGVVTPGTPGTPVGATISPAGDIDWYKFATIAGHSYQIKTAGAVTTRVTLVGSDGSTVLTGPVAAPVYLTATDGGPTFVLVAASASTSTGTYSLLVNDLGADDHGDDAAHATQLQIGTTGLGGWIMPAADNDWFKFEATANRVYKVDTADMDTYVYLVDTDGTTILKASDPVPVYLYATVAGTYYVRVRHFSATSVGQYTVKVEETGTDDHGNDAPHATIANTTGTGIAGVINYPGDDDWFKFQATANHLYSINTAYRSPSTYFDSYVYVLDTNGTTVLKESDPVPVVFGASADGWYYVRVRHYSTTTTGCYYTLTITDVGPDDCSSGPGANCVIVPGAPPGTAVPGRIEVGGDDDWYAIDATAGHIYRCTTTGIDTYVYLFDTDGTTVRTQSDNPLVYFAAQQSGRYYYKVKAVSTYTAGDYAVTCTDEGADDYPDGPVGAPVIPTDGTVQSGAIQLPGDVDWFAFVAAADTTYKIAAPPVAGADTVVELYSTSGGSLLTSARTPATISRKLTEAGTYFLKVRLYASTTTGAYTLTVTQQ